MTTLHLELDIDSEVHPELFVRLSALERSAARQEKMRQLAATGLIWEITRLYGSPFADSESPAEEPPPRAHADAESLLAGPAHASRDALAVDAGTVADHPPRVPVNVPVLFDVVEEVEVLGAAAPEEAGAESVVANVVPLHVPTPEAEEPPASASPRESSAGRTRSARIKRMKESGLFQNG